MGQENQPKSLPPLEPLFPPKETGVVKAKGKPQTAPPQPPRSLEEIADEIFADPDPLAPKPEDVPVG